MDLQKFWATNENLPPEEAAVVVCQRLTALQPADIVDYYRAFSKRSPVRICASREPTSESRLSQYEKRATTADPPLRWLAVYGPKIVGVAAGYFLLIALRTHVFCSQLSRGRPQMFDRPAPEWITLLFLVGGLVIVFRPL